ncbi:MAG: hypothetical protein WCG27_05385 [Pseudomonadota bacterium]
MKIVSCFGTLMRLASALGKSEVQLKRAKESGLSTPEQISELESQFVEAKQAHDSYLCICKSSDEMMIGVNVRNIC